MEDGNTRWSNRYILGWKQKTEFKCIMYNGIDGWFNSATENREQTLIKQQQYCHFEFDFGQNRFAK